MQKGRSLSTGCVLCHQGAKMVLFLSGLCPRSCWYCPLSKERKERDVIYANERRIHTPEEAASVARLMSALGTGITGGEPLSVPQRLQEYARFLKREFGNSHHIHLYTGMAPAREDLSGLVGLVDEIRMHPPQEIWDRIVDTPYMEAAHNARVLGFSVGFEVPSLPGIDSLESMLPFLDFMNINELEWGETNAVAMRERRMVLDDGVHNAVSGARGWARRLTGHPKVHWCSSRFKDSVQLRKRLLRVAKNTARPFDQITRDGTILYGLLENEGVVPALFHQLEPDMYEEKDGAFETAWWVLTEFGNQIEGKKTIIERYPDRGLVVEVTPIE
ncbi:MAG: hypothetical protein A4E40_00757 [Methanoregulaceae archaeon PtaU1.Bin059]|nr:MAG: hypothetical protein A4E39_02016 [Methanoregulaceae archaeon PtaB.Bin152]OPY40763.1 MAG: hypothetical protein A4E40_00757 [Methanoregulaceae archaeon PtaU1.Bin059]